jgi:hypothetical protein
MPTLTASDRAYLRAVTGDTNASDYFVTDEQITAYYDEADGNLPKTVVFLLRQMMGKAVHRTDESGEFGTNRNSQLFVNIRDKLLPYWEKQAGMISGGTLAVGTLNLGIDATEDNEWQ